MRASTLSVIFGVLAWALAAPALAQGAADAGAPSGSYRVGAGDRLTVTVYDEPDLSVSGMRVKGDGTIALPLIGELRVGGMSSPEIRDLVKRRLADGYLKKPHVSVSIEQYRLYYIKGEVNRPGGYSFVEGLTVEQAIALAGGYTERASEEKITLVREASPSNPERGVARDMRVRPGDVITVGESFF